MYNLKKVQLYFPCRHLDQDHIIDSDYITYTFLKIKS